MPPVAIREVPGSGCGQARSPPLSSSSNHAGGAATSAMAVLRGALRRGPGGSAEVAGGCDNRLVRAARRAPARCAAPLAPLPPVRRRGPLGALAPGGWGLWVGPASPWLLAIAERALRQGRKNAGQRRSAPRRGDRLKRRCSAVKPTPSLRQRLPADDSCASAATGPRAPSPKPTASTPLHASVSNPARRSAQTPRARARYRVKSGESSADRRAPGVRHHRGVASRQQLHPLVVIRPGEVPPLIAPVPFAPPAPRRNDAERIRDAVASSSWRPPSPTRRQKRVDAPP